MRRPSRNSPEVRERAVRMVLEDTREHESRCAVIQAFASEVGCSAETLRKRIRHTERDQGCSLGLTSERRNNLRELERENHETPRPTKSFRKRRYASRGRSSSAEKSYAGASMTPEVRTESSRSTRWSRPLRPPASHRRSLRPILGACRPRLVGKRSCGSTSTGSGGATPAYTEPARCVAS